MHLVSLYVNHKKKYFYPEGAYHFVERTGNKKVKSQKCDFHQGLPNYNQGPLANNICYIFKELQSKTKQRIYRRDQCG